MAHDYAYSREEFNKCVDNDFWNYCEIEEKDISNAITQHNLINILGEEFARVGWCCKIKIDY